MLKPRPLTLCPEPQLDWSRPDTPAASDFGDIYFSTDGGLEETRTVFLKGCGLPDAWQYTERFVIGELGFGSGLNFLAAWQMWNQSKPRNGHLHFVSIEKFPFDAKSLSRALSVWPELSHYTEKLIKAWPDRVRGFHRLHFDDVTLTLVHDDIENALNAVNVKANAWFLDGFSPAKNPDMWSRQTMSIVAKLSAPGARLATFTVAGQVRRALTDVGFKVEKKSGFGRKRHRLEAQFDGKLECFEYSKYPTPIIIGTGIGGVSLAKAFLRRGVTPNIIDDPSHIKASGNPAALVKPRLDLQDRPESRFFLASYLYALKEHEKFAVSKGVIQIAKTEKEGLRHQKLCDQSSLPATHLRLGLDNALELSESLTIDPHAYREHVLLEIPIKQMKIKNLTSLSRPAFIAAGFGIKQLLPKWPIRFSRGQISWAETNKKIKTALSYGGYALPLKESLLLGATHDRLSKENPFAIRKDDDEKNRTLLKEYFGIVATTAGKPSRASVRVTSQDALPVIGKTDHGHFVLTGLGSRGFVFAPLLAEAIVSDFYGDPSPIDKAVWQRFSAKRLFN